VFSNSILLHIDHEVLFFKCGYCLIALFLLVNYSVNFTANYKKYLLIMQVDNSTLHLTHLIPQEDIHNAIPFSALLPLHGYHHKLSITALPWSLPDFATHIASLPAELIDMIQAFCAHDDLLALTSIDKTALATRFCNPRLQSLCFSSIKDTKQFLSYCQASQEKKAQELILEGGKISRSHLKPALSPNLTRRFISFTGENLQEVKTITLTLSVHSTAEQYDLLFTYLREIQHLTIQSTLQNSYDLGILLKATQGLNLYYLDICQACRVSAYIEDHLPDELWQFTTLEILTINNFKLIFRT
jgi:hypothetical protein